MNLTSLILLLYIAWILVLLVAIATHRSFLTLVGKRAANSFNPDGSDVSPAGHRLVRVHANCLEGFPIYGGLMLVAMLTKQTALLDGTVVVWFVARMGQSITHLFSTHPTAVIVRFSFFSVQVGLAFWWLLQLSGVLK
jgi:uncharacterized MAPEG superfamily protein